LSLGAVVARHAAADPPAPPAKNPAPASDAPTGDLTNPRQRDLRNTAYSLPQGLWAVEVGALGSGGGETYAKLGVGYGLGAGVELDVNVAHVSVGVANLAARWNFLDTRYLALGVGAGVWYGHGEWMWFLTGTAKSLVSKIDVFHVPLRVSASSLVLPWLGLDLTAQYSYANLYGNVVDRDSLFVESGLGIRQFFLRPAVRFYVADRVELDLASDLPLYSAVPVETTGAQGNQHEHTFENIPFSDVWSAEAAVRSRFAAGVFGNVRLHYGKVAKALYGAPLFPSFEVEFRF
jgi:hypothetical protein